MADFREDDHPRDEKGRFTAGSLSLAAEGWRARRGNKSYVPKDVSFERSFSKVGKDKTRNQLTHEMAKIDDKRSAIRRDFQKETGQSSYVAENHFANKDLPDDDPNKAKYWVMAPGERRDKVEAAWPAFKAKLEELDWQYDRARREAGAAGYPERDSLQKDSTKKAWDATRLGKKQQGALDNKLTGEKGTPLDTKKLEAAKKKRSETVAVSRALAQKDSPIDLLDLAALQLDQTAVNYGRRATKAEQIRDRSSELYWQSRDLVNRLLGAYLTDGKPGIRAGWYGQFDPRNGREVEWVSERQLNRKIGKPEYAGMEVNKHLRLKNERGEDVDDEFSQPSYGQPGYGDGKSLREHAEEKGYKVWGPKTHGWYYRDTMDQENPEPVPPVTGGKSKENDEYLSMRWDRFPVTVHPALAGKIVPGTKKTWAQWAWEKAHTGTGVHWEQPHRDGTMNHGAWDETHGWDGAIDAGLPASVQNKMDRATLELWKKLEPKIREDMAKDGSYNRFWTHDHIMEGTAGDKYGGALLGLGGQIEKRKKTNEYDPATHRYKEEITQHPLADLLTEWAHGDRGQKTMKSRMPTRQWNEDAWAGKVDPWTDDPMTREMAEKSGKLKKYVEGVKARRASTG